MMSDEQENFIEVAQPECMGLGPDEVLIFDLPAFAEKYKCDAAMLTGNQLFVLDSESRKWVSVEPPEKPVNRVRALKTIKD